jgi:hypothetical protein
MADWLCYVHMFRGKGMDELRLWQKLAVYNFPEIPLVTVLLARYDIFHTVKTLLLLSCNIIIPGIVWSRIKYHNCTVYQ